MSRLNFKNLNREYTFGKAPTIRYTKTDNSFTINTLDSVDDYYLNYKVAESDLLRMIGIDFYDKDEQAELFYKRLLPSVEQRELDDDTFNSVSVCQWYYNLSPRVLKLAKRQAHLHRLRRVESPVLTLSPRVFHSKGGRPKGSRNKVDEDRLEYLRSKYDEIVKNCVKHDWYEEYVTLNKELGIKKTYEDFVDLKKRV